MTRLTTLTIFLLFSSLLFSQEATISHICDLTNKLDETSGLIYFDNSYWTINDSGNEACLYRINEEGEVNQTIKIANAKNIDWEDITQDEENIYIADTGNNNGNRTIFTIYKIRKKDIPPSKEDIHILAKIIDFKYEDQGTNLQPYAHNFDCEALISFNDQLGLFTKNWADGKSSFYIINTTERVAKPQFTINSYGLITGADFNKVNNEVLLIGYQYINQTQLPFFIKITDFLDPSKQKETRIQLSEINGQQTEAICIGKYGITISNEKTQHFKPSLQTILRD
ncbi:hypothetical protein [Carboxylicivirga linearis]|uniref:T9SS C-terminal target domain-containing protein n=1 Tax=Carboxylicivirga linearis TaxID=1628157 RepID=A0ABS5JVK3_9BACT|nr:hypothetical protein [Carboxylicivirga linearis]MBS2098917.1 hypothetical protein [Carboxylicivirga linearis]